MEIEHIKITDLKPAEYNPRRISDDDYQKLKNSMVKILDILRLVVFVRIN